MPPRNREEPLLSFDIRDEEWFGKETITLHVICRVYCANCGWRGNRRVLAVKGYGQLYDRRKMTAAVAGKPDTKVCHRCQRASVFFGEAYRVC